MDLIEHSCSDDQLDGSCNGRNSRSIDDYLCYPGQHLRVYRSERHGGNAGFDQPDAGESFVDGRKHTPIHGNGNVQ
jgi:hypothetical protein